MSTVREDLRISACASPVRDDAIPDELETIATVVTVALLGSPGTDDVLAVDAPRGAMLPRQCFSARYLTREGARRVLLRSIDVEPRPRMRDHVTVRRLTAPVPAPERATYREPIGLRLRGEVARSAKLPEGFAVTVDVLNASTGGLALDTPAPLHQGDAVWIVAPPNPELEGTTIEILRRDAGNTTRFGGRFGHPAEGLKMFSALVAAARERRSERPRVAATPAPAVTAPAPAPDNGSGMHTRRRRDQS